ncbi:MAG: radical SAM protein, partial [Candidatus Bathyarchaeia archaeon]
MPDVAEHLERFYCDFASDMRELNESIASVNVNPHEVATKASLRTDEKIRMFTKLTEKTKAVEHMLSLKNPQAWKHVEGVFRDWSEHIIETRLRQEYETIKGFLITVELATTVGVPRLRAAMNRVQEKFGEETVRIALDVTLNVGLRREKLQTIMLSDHFINYTMDIEKLDGQMQFVNCPIFGGHEYITEELGVSDDVASLFCTHFCYSHAKAMLKAVLPFTFELWQPQRMATDGKCEFYIKLAHSPTASKHEKFVPLILSWNVTRQCNLKCPHCYINATGKKPINELTTEEAKKLIDQICEVSRPLLVLSGGEPLLRSDIYELIRYGSSKGLKMGLGSNGSLIDDGAAK